MNLSIEQWEALPWHHQQVYLQELVNEFPQVFGEYEELDGTESDEATLDRAQRMGMNIQYV